MLQVVDLHSSESFGSLDVPLLGIAPRRGGPGEEYEVPDGTPEHVRWCADRDEALDVVRKSSHANDVVLVKASRIAHLEEMVEAVHSPR